MTSKRMPIDGSHKRDIHSDASVFYQDYWIKGGQRSAESTKRALEIIPDVFPAGEPHGLSIIELGVGGEGGLLAFLKEKNTVRGFDVSATAISMCKDRGVPAAVLDVDKEPMPFEDGSLDVVIACEVFEHLANPQKVIEEIRRTLKPHGVLTLTTPHPFIHHWPRIFYPTLFSREAFRDFILVNRFRLRMERDIGENAYKFLAPDERAWSYVWVAERLDDGDQNELMAIGRYFFEKRNSAGVRTHAIEACDLFRSVWSRDPKNIEPACWLALALVYRVINGELKEFNSLIAAIDRQARNESSPQYQLARSSLDTINIELAQFGLNLGRIAPG